MPQHPASPTSAPRDGAEEIGRHRLTEARALEINESLQSLVRHQLELLATPVLRWEGDVWSGIFMALMIQMPGMSGGQREPGAGSEGEEGDEEPKEKQESWSSELTLDIHDLGRLQVSLLLKQEDHLDLTLRAPSAGVLERLEAGRASLLARLQDCGFAEPAMRFTLSDELPGGFSGERAGELGGEARTDG